MHRVVVAVSTQSVNQNLFPLLFGLAAIETKPIGKSNRLLTLTCAIINHITN